MTKRDSEQWFGYVGQQVRSAYAAGTLDNEIVEKRKFQLEYMCGRCDDLHQVSGTLQQCVAAAHGLFLLGVPDVRVTDEAYAMEQSMEMADVEVGITPSGLGPLVIEKFLPGTSRKSMTAADQKDRPIYGVLDAGTEQVFMFKTEREAIWKSLKLSLRDVVILTRALLFGKR